MKRLSILIAALCMGVCGAAAQNKYQVETFKAPKGGEVKITLISHGSICIDYQGMNIQIDPVGDYSSFPKADFIFITHEHGDHLNKQNIDLLSKSSTVIYANAKSQQQIGKGTVANNGDKFVLKSDVASVTAVPAYNSTAGRENFHPKGNGNGYVFDLGGLKVYVAGDTEDIPEMAQIADMDIDVAFLPVNQPYTMTPEQCIKAAGVIRTKILIPYHLGQTDFSAIKSGLEQSGIDLRLFECLR